MTNTPKSRRVTPRAWATLTLSGAALGLTVSNAVAADLHATAGGPEKLWLAQASTEGGEGDEGGEAGAIAGDESVALLTGLGLIEGHLRAGVALYEAGLADQAKSHMKHPQDELYASLLPLLKAAGAEDFSGALTGLSDAVENGADMARVQAAFAEVQKEIAEGREHAGGGEAAEAAAIVRIVTTAAEEYALGVQDGTVAELHEYHDAWGFVEVARALLTHMAGEDDAAEKAFGENSLAALADLAPALPGVSPEGKTLGDASALYGAAASIELAAYKLK
jgi:hypothetical protein